MTSDESLCPVCKQSVDTVVRRHKTFGVFVPLWGPGPCRNSRCASYEAGEEAGKPDEAEPVLTASEAEPVLRAEPRPPAEARASTERQS